MIALRGSGQLRLEAIAFGGMGDFPPPEADPP